MVKVLAGLAVARASSFEEIANRVNALGTSWTAQIPGKFASIDEVKPFLGAFLPGDAEYTEPEVKEVSVNAQDIPASFDSAEQWPACSVISNVRDQSSCGTCWAFASTESFESRACIATGKDIKYSPEDTGFCSNAGFGCSGGNSAWNWFQSNGVVTGGDYTEIGSGDTCLPYSLKPCAHHVPASDKYEPCPSSEYPSPSCKSSCSEDSYAKDYQSDKIKADSSYSVRGVEQIQQELMQNGPLYVAFTVYDDFPTYKSGVYHATSRNQLGGHAVLLVGWGTEDGQDYWKIKNSWNEQWGDAGYFLIRRGNNECGIESSVSGGLVSGQPAPPSPPAPVPSQPCSFHFEESECESSKEDTHTCAWCEKMHMCFRDDMRPSFCDTVV